MLGCCQSLGRVSTMDRPHAMTIQPCLELKDTTIEPLDNKERENLERQDTKDPGDTLGHEDDLQDDEMEKNDSVKDSVSSEILEAPQSLSYDGDDVSYSEDNSMDNNTFNIINTEDSQSQEVSDMTNDESPMILNENGESKENRITRETDEDSDEELSCLEEEEELEEDEEVTEESGDSDKRSGSDGGEESDDEREFDNDSLEDEGKNSDSAICVTESVPRLDLPEPPLDPLASAKQKTGEGKPVSPPKMRRRLRSFGKKEKQEFTIEIYESRRKPQDIPSLTFPGEENTLNNDTSPGNDLGGENKNMGGCSGPGETGVTGGTLISPGSSLTTPDSTDNTLAVSLDISNTIREETDESDMFSPLKTPTDGPLTPGTKSDSEPREKNNLSSTATTTSTTTTTTTSTTTTTPTTTSTTTSRSAPPKTPTTTGPTNDAKKVNNSARTSTEKLKKGIESELEVTESEERRRGGGGGGGGGSSLEKEDPGTESEPKKHYPMAFTVDIGDGSGNSEAAATKKLDIAASISKWAPKHRRNLSLTKVDEHKKVEERSAKPPLGRPRSGTVGAAAGLAGRRGGYHSEGYFSSDQDDDNPRRTELKSPRSPRTPELRSPQTPQRLVRSSSQDSAKGGSLRMHSTPSPDTPRGAPAAPHSLPALTLHESASFLLEKMMTTAPESLRKHQGSRSEGRPCCRTEGKKPTLAEATGRSGKNKAMDRMNAECRKQSSSVTSLSSSHTFEMKQDPAKEEKDDVSEAGTYTIEKDSSSPEVEQARSDIDRVFGISGTESEVEGGGLGSNQLTPRGPPPPPDDPWASPAGADQDKFKSPGSLSRNSPNWIQQWAAQVAEHTKTTSELSKPPQSSPRGTRGAANTTASPSPLNPLNTHSISLSSSQESSEARPRRKLPTPPTAPLKGGGGGGGGDGLSDGECPPGKGRARVGAAQTGVALRGSSFESHDSGGDSDIDTSTSYPTQEDERLSHIGTQLKARLRLVGIDGGSIGARTPPQAPSPRRPLGTSGSDTQEVVRKGFRRERSNVSDGAYDGYLGRDDGTASDSSSDGSDGLGAGGSVGAGVAKKNVENNPPLKFNRAFSLRRARLGCDDTQTQPVKPPSPIDKKKATIRPSSAGSLTGVRKLPLGHSKSQVGVGQRGVGISGAGHGQSSLPAAPRSTNANADFSRGDGGRFSLRLPRSGSTSAVSKSPSRASSIQKEGSIGGGGVGGGGRRRGVAAPRSNSTLSAKEVDFQNWKRRKNYDPMKAAAEGRKKVTDKRGVEKGGSGGGGGGGGGVDRSPSPPASLLRSASFHGTEGMGASGAGRWPRPRPHHLYPSEDEGPYSLEEEQPPHPVPHCSPLRRSPTSPHQLCSPHTTSPAHQPNSLTSVARARRSSYAMSDDGEGQVTSPTRKTSLDESGSEGKRSPISSTRGLVSSRSKAKMEALDNLVISTIHSLSVKVRTTSETLLQKLKSQYDEEGDRAALLEEVLAHLSESDQLTGGGGGGRSTSRELAGILRNLKKIEHALEVIDRVMICVDDDDDDDDDEGRGGRGGGADWGESDY